jgi:DNA processing protein
LEPVDREEIRATLLYNRVSNYTPVQKYSLYKRFGSVLGLFSERVAAESVYNKPLKVDGEQLNALCMQCMTKRVETEFAYCHEHGISILTLGDSSYPEYLRHIDDPPIVLFGRGRIELLANHVLFGIVGARKASNSSINSGYAVARDLARNGVTVVSGLATGIDYYAHKGALDGSGGTIAVLGNGIDLVYPKSNRDMYERIEDEGLLLSEFPIGTEPLKYNFPKRNRVISGLSRGILVVEATVKSGALITANYALDQGREVMALPGRAGSDSFQGNNRLIKEGAHLVEDAEDICAILGVEYKEASRITAKGPHISGITASGITASGSNALPFSPMECTILSVIGDDLVNIEEIEKNMKGPISKIASALTMLELKGAVIQYPGKNYTRVE